MYKTSKRFSNVEEKAMLTPGPGAFAEERNEGKNTFLKQKQSIETRRKQSSFLHPKNTRKPTFGASSRNDKSPWSYLTNATHKGLSATINSFPILYSFNAIFNPGWATGLLFPLPLRDGN